MPAEVMAIKKVEEQKFLDWAVAQLIIKSANKKEFCELQTSFDMYTLEDILYPYMVKTIMTAIKIFKSNFHINAALH